MKLSEKLSKLSPETLNALRASLEKQGYQLGEGITGFDLDFSGSDTPDVDTRIYTRIYHNRIAHFFGIYSFLETEGYVYEYQLPEPLPEDMQSAFDVRYLPF